MFSEECCDTKHIHEGHLTDNEGLSFTTVLEQNNSCILARVLTIHSTTARTVGSALVSGSP